MQWAGAGCYHDPTKSIIIVHPDNIEAAKIFFMNIGFTVLTGARFLAGYIGYDKPKRVWLKNWTEKGRDFFAVTKTAGKYPQENYAIPLKPVANYVYSRLNTITPCWLKSAT